LRHAADHHHALVERQVYDAAHSGSPNGSMRLACSSKCSPRSWSALAPARVRDFSDRRRHAAACSRRPSAVSSCDGPVGLSLESNTSSWSGFALVVRLQVDCGHLAAAVLLQLVADALILVQRAHAAVLDRGDEDEGVGAAAVRSDEAVALVVVEEFHRSGGHVLVSFWSGTELPA